MARITIDLTVDAASPCDDTLPEWTEIRDDGDVVLCFGDIELRMTDPQFVALMELAGKFQGVDPFTGEEIAPPEEE